VDTIKKRFPKDHVCILSVVKDGNAYFACGSNAAVSADELLKHMLKAHGGSGGGRKDFAQGGIKDFSDVEKVVLTGLAFIKEKSA
jgi:alanyl-tRNA synthetase